MACVLDGFSFATAAEKQLTDNKNTVKSIAFLVVGLESGV